MPLDAGRGLDGYPCTLPRNVHGSRWPLGFAELAAAAIRRLGPLARAAGTAGVQ